MNIAIKSEDERRLLAYIDEHRDKLFSMLSDLVRVDTQNFRDHGNENAGQDLLARMCVRAGLTVDRFAPDSVAGVTEAPDYMLGRGTDARENLVAFFPENAVFRSVMLAAHMDTVPIGNTAAWEGDPLSGEIRDGKIYGRGAGDDKFGLAAALFLMCAFRETDVSPKKKLLLGSYVDEEGGGGGGALALAKKHPVDCLINLDASRFECESLGGGCFTVSLRTTENDHAIASVFDVFTGLNLIKVELEKLHGTGKNSIRLSSVKAGTEGDKSGSLSFAIYTDMTREETEARLAAIYESLTPAFDDLKLTGEGFRLVTRFFLYGETAKDSPEAKALTTLLTEETGKAPDTSGSCLSDLSLLLRYGTKNSFNYGMVRGSKTGGGAHQPNEHIDCEEFICFVKRLALLLMRS